MCRYLIKARTYKYLHKKNVGKISLRVKKRKNKVTKDTKQKEKVTSLTYVMLNFIKVESCTEKRGFNNDNSKLLT